MLGMFPGSNVFYKKLCTNKLKINVLVLENLSTAPVTNVFFQWVELGLDFQGI